MKDILEFNYNTDENLKEYEVLFNNLLKSAKEVLDINQNLSFSVNYIDEIKSRKLNNEYRKKDYVGDVISFPIDDDFGIYNQLDFKEIGDIFITFSEAKNKALKYNHTIKEEMAWLFVHGLLHILGYDHEISENEEKLMFDLTDQILNKQNIKYKMPF
ncbi:rRNA maturation RNase YbeY [Spiroplasma cantharicola]|uniref:Endoribonuclease YbeY n=1 Tax=Spiroplasma cantharicola TaxID=362837 RepID=A0A0M4KCW0_9MOLU|nr:rRNA maturation RNase YbeY [Spiroplasma cantharicola]ALD66640.1 16S rRNA maturation RNase YbeY [Spiroplasma cantharicola]